MSGTPPRVLPGLSAQGRLRAVIALVLACVIGLVVLTPLAQSGRVTPYAVLAVGSAALLTLLVGLPVVGGRHVRELQGGYTTLRLLVGQPALVGIMRPVRGGRLSWDYAGTWVLRPSGEVVAAPTPGAIPPGFYPSPGAPGRFELWTGAEWARQYRRRRR